MAMCDSYPAGATLVVVDKVGKWAEATVRRKVRFSRFVLAETMYGDAAEGYEMDLNEANHYTPRIRLAEYTRVACHHLHRAPADRMAHF
jgi:hypothetical protein